jgi:hypothetical protein
MSVAPMKYAERAALGQHLIDEDHDLLVDMYRGFSPAGVFRTPWNYLISTDGTDVYASNAFQTVYGGSTNENSIEGDDADASLVVQACIDDLAATGGLIQFTSQPFTFTNPLVLPDQTKSLKFHGTCGYQKSGDSTGTSLISSIIGDALFKQTSTIDYRASYGLEWRNIAFKGPHTAASTALHLTNATTGEIASNMFFGFGTSIWGDMNHNVITPENRDLIVWEMPGLFDVHDNIFTEGHLTYLNFDMFMQSKIHDNEFESWGPFTSHIQLKNTNVIQISGNRFTGNDTSVALDEVIGIDTDNQIYCSQIQINDNIAYLGSGTPGTYPFIRLTNTYVPLTPSNTITSRNNTLVLDYEVDIADILASGLYSQTDWATKGGIDAHDHIRTFNDTENLKDFTSSLANNTNYQNFWAPLQLYFSFANVDAGSACILYMGKTTGAMITCGQYYNNTAGAGDDSITLMIDVPVGWYFKYVVAGNTTLDACYGVYH